ncbi:hypothetical protein F4825DRAFT_416098 [Nemania diffusa]|nr:hypothetical protein F4825DRAFT_416098 [Nemania diffusa]
MAERSRAEFNSLPVEILIEIYSCIVDSDSSLVALSSVLRFMRAVLKLHESVIARNMAIKIIDVDKEEDVKLAFIAAGVGFINVWSPDAVHKFCDAFVRRGRWPLSLYPVCLIPVVRQNHQALAAFVAWDWSHTELPLAPTVEDMSRTEAVRLRRYGYIMEIALNLVECVSKYPPCTDMDVDSELGSRLTNFVSQPLLEIAAKF